MGPGTVVIASTAYMGPGSQRVKMTENLPDSKISTSRSRHIKIRLRDYSEIKTWCFLQTLQTDIWLVVRVPVLSEQMIDVQPSVSTDGRLRTIAFFLAIRRVPSARHVVMTAGRPSGIAATASATAILK